MRQIQFVVSGVPVGAPSEYSLDEEEFASSEDFDNFRDWAVELIRVVRATEGARITNVKIVETEELEDYEV